MTVDKKAEDDADMAAIRRQVSIMWPLVLLGQALALGWGFYKGETLQCVTLAFSLWVSSMAARFWWATERARLRRG